MAIRKVREVGDDVLAKECREVKKMTPRISQLIDDMFDTMYEYNGVGLAAPQVGVLRRIIVVDVGEDPRALINPRIVHEEGKQTGEEGCLSLPGKYGIVTRPMKVTVEGLDRDMNPVTWEAEGLLARAFCHEVDHLDGHMYTEFVEGEIHDTALEEAMEEQENAVK